MSDLKQEKSNSQQNIEALFFDAVSKNDVAVLGKILDEKKIDINVATTSYGFTALMLAASYNHLEAVTLLLERGADPDLGNKSYTPLILSTIAAIREKNYQLITLLLQKAEVNKLTEDSSSLMEAVLWGNESLVRLLLSHGADSHSLQFYLPIPMARHIDDRDIYRASFVHIKVPVIVHAAAAGHTSIVALLLSILKEKPKTNLPKILKAALEAAIVNKQINTIQFLLENGADVNSSIELSLLKSRTPLQIAAESDDPAVVTKLLERKPNLNTRNSSGETALYIAASKGNDAVVKLLLDSKADINQAAYHQKKWSEIEDFKESFIEKIPGMSPLMVAVTRGHASTVKLLVEHKADLSSVDPKSRTAVDLAKEALENWEQWPPQGSKGIAKRILHMENFTHIIKLLTASKEVTVSPSNLPQPKEAFQPSSTVLALGQSLSGVIQAKSTLPSGIPPTESTNDQEDSEKNDPRFFP